MEITIDRVTKIRDLEIYRELAFKEAKLDGYIDKIPNDLSTKDKEFFINNHAIYLIRNNNTSEILGGFMVLYLETGAFYLWGLVIKEAYKNKGIGTQALKYVYSNYEDLFFRTPFDKLQWYAKSLFSNMYIATDALVFKSKDMVYTINPRYLTDYEDKLTIEERVWLKKWEPFVSIKTNIFDPNEEDHVYNSYFNANELLKVWFSI